MILYGFFGLGLAEIAIVAIAMIILLNPKNVTMIKPMVKKAYRWWVIYQKEAQEAEGEMEEIKQSVMGPIIDAEKEVEAEIRSEGLDKDFKAATTSLKDATAKFKSTKSQIQSGLRINDMRPPAVQNRMTRGPPSLKQTKEPVAAPKQYKAPIQTANVPVAPAPKKKAPKPTPSKKKATKAKAGKKKATAKKLTKRKRK